MFNLNEAAHVAAAWLAEQQQLDRDLFLIVDRLADPDPIPELFALDLMQDYINLYQASEWDDMASISPWLVRAPDGQVEQLVGLLNTPQRNWGWLASASQLDLSKLTLHWQDRLVIEQGGSRALYRFQDNRVIAHHLQSLTRQQLPLLMGPLQSALCWHKDAWLITNNPSPGFYTLPFDRPWLDVPEPATIQRDILSHNLQQWLWSEHSSETTRLASTEPLAPWLSRQLGTAERWGWHDMEQIHFLLRHQLDPAAADHAAWAAQDGETPEVHYRRCYRALQSGIYS